jgi:hypothetical protein
MQRQPSLPHDRDVIGGALDLADLTVELAEERVGFGDV